MCYAATSLVLTCAMLLPDGRSILHMASAEGNYKMVEMLLEQVVPTVVLACGTTLQY